MRWVSVVVGPTTGLAVAAAVLWTATNELLIQPTEYTCFNLALEKIKCRPLTALSPFCASPHQPPFMQSFSH